MCVCGSGSVHGEKQKVTDGCLSQSLSALLFETGLSVNLELMESAGLSGHMTPRVLWFLSEPELVELAGLARPYDSQGPLVSISPVLGRGS